MADVRAWCALAVQAYAADDPARCPIGSLFHELGERDAAARAALAAGFGRWRTALAEGLRRVHARGELRAGVDPDAAAAALLAAHQGGVLLAGATGDREHLRLALETFPLTALADPPR